MIHGLSAVAIDPWAVMKRRAEAGNIQNVRSVNAPEATIAASSESKLHRRRGTKRGRPSESEKNDRIAHLIDVTTRIFVNEGYEAVTTRRISVEAGISAKSIYAWFPDKLALFTEVMNRLPTRFQPRKAMQPIVELTLEEALYQQAKAMIENLLHPEAIAVATFLNREGYKFQEFRTFLREQNLSNNIANIKMIFAAKLSGKFSESDLHENSMLFFYIVHGEMSRSILHDLELPTPERVDAYAKRVASIFVWGVSSDYARSYKD